MQAKTEKVIPESRPKTVFSKSVRKAVLSTSERHEVVGDLKVSSREGGSSF